jgi:hypothetical protein
MSCDPPEGGGDEKFYVAVFPELTIYGHTVDSWTKTRYPEDWQHTQDGRRRGMEFGCWHSVACPDGEIGSNDMRVLAPISYEQFVEAREKGWPDDYVPTTDAPVSGIAEILPDGTLKPVWDSLRGDYPEEKGD